jgi:hypothetical protein
MFKEPYVVLLRNFSIEPGKIFNHGETGYVLAYSGVSPMWYCTEKENFIMVKLALAGDAIQWHSDLDDFEEILAAYLDQHGTELDDIPVSDWNPLFRMSNSVRVRNDSLWADKLKQKHLWMKKP